MNRSLLVGGVVALVGCGAGGQGPVDARAFLDAVDVQGATDVVPSPDVPVGHLVDGGCDASGSCNADFPCGGRRFACLGTAQWQRVVTRDCSFVCGCVPCSGASCELDGPVQSCVAGTACTVSSPGSGALDTRATPCEVPVPDEGVEVRTARVRGLLVGSWSGHRFSSGAEETFFFSTCAPTAARQSVAPTRTSPVPRSGMPRRATVVGEAGPSTRSAPCTARGPCAW